MSQRATYGSVARRSIGTFSPWLVATTAYVVGSLVAGLGSLGLALAGYAEAPPIGPADLVHLFATRTIPARDLITFAITQGLAILAQAAWLVGRGKHPFLAPVASLLVAWAVAAIIAPFELPHLAVLYGTAVVQILVIAASIGRQRR